MTAGKMDWSRSSRSGGEEDVEAGWLGGGDSSALAADGTIPCCSGELLGEPGGEPEGDSGSDEGERRPDGGIFMVRTQVVNECFESVHAPDSSAELIIVASIAPKSLTNKRKRRAPESRMTQRIRQ